MKVSKEQTYSFSEVAQELGITEEVLIIVAMNEGLIDENGMPTEYAQSMKNLFVWRYRLIFALTDLIDHGQRTT